MARSYPIINSPNGQSRWHCRMLQVSGGAACPNMDVLSVCLKSY